MTNTVTIPGPAKPADDAARPPEERLLTPSLGRARAFTTRIDQRSHDDPGVRAALRRGVGKDLDAVPFMHRYVASWLNDDQARDHDIQRAFYTVASLIAAQRRDQYAAGKTKASKNTGPEDEAPDGTEEPADAPGAAPAEGAQPATPKRVPPRSLGRAFADGVLSRGQGAGLRETSAETRLNVLTRQSVDGLHRHLPGVIRQLRDREVEIDWAQLLVDLCQWRRRSGTIKRIWLQDYHRTLRKDGERRAREQDDKDVGTSENDADSTADTEPGS
ncbi:type I-E CRISPR-associated protein Cse2/CasB [Kitasatospora sp. NPDC094011]|uniref:type I-E CRISPR-associated protein Cse2/CasB n=1 Tax=Kitasatospora sp. NPDC094011 TaxID=3364090 RepID=UPI003815DB43